jgi:hypothetical protein
MSPGAFWGRPGGGVNPFINPAVGAPVHGSPGGFFGMHPVSPPITDGEPAGYFPPVPVQGPPPDQEEYFPPVLTGNDLTSSTLANEILRDSHSLERYADYRGDRLGSSSSADSTAGTGSGDWRPSSSTGTSWNASDNEGSHEKREEHVVIIMEGGDHDIPERGGRPASRTHSVMNSEKRPTLETVGRADSDPIQGHSRESESEAELV